MQIANPFAHLIQQFGGPERDPVKFVGLNRLVHAYSMLRCRLDITHIFAMPWGFV